MFHKEMCHVSSLQEEMLIITSGDLILITTFFSVLISNPPCGLCVKRLSLMTPKHIAVKRNRKRKLITAVASVGQVKAKVKSSDPLKLTR